MDRTRRPRYSDVCEKCYSEWHCCLNSGFHDEFAHNQCRNPSTEMVSDREKRNHCEEFRLVDREETQPTTTDDDAKKKWDSLFGN